jgi:Protein of unknown function (DUF551)
MKQETLKLIEELAKEHYTTGTWEYADFKTNAEIILTNPAILESEGLSRNEWVKCEDRLPENNPYQASTVLTFGYNDGYVADYQDNNFFSREYNDDNGNPMIITAYITHWMPLPAPPKNDKQ